MPTVIDALVVSLGLDASGYVKGQKDASGALKKTEGEATRTAKELEARGKQAGTFFGSIKTQVVGLLAAFTAGAGIKSFVSNIVGSDAAMGRMAKNVGMATDEFSSWQSVAERAGGSAGGMAGSIKNLAGEMQELALTGQSSAIPFLTAAHVNLSKFFDATTPMSEKLLELSDAFQGMDPAKAQALGAGIGLDEGTINVLMQGRTAVMALLAEQQKIGHTNAADAASAQRLQSAWRALGQSSEDLGRKLLTAAAPVIERLSNALLRLSEWAATHRPMVEATFWGLAAAATAFAVVLAAPVAGIAALSAGIGVAVAAIAVLYDDWSSWISGGQSAFGGFWQYFADKWAEAGPTVMKALASLEAMFFDTVAVLGDGMRLIYTLFFGTSDQVRAAWSTLMADLREWFADAVQGLTDTISALPASWQSAIGKIINVFRDGVSVIEAAWRVIYDLFTGNFDDLGNAWAKLMADMSRYATDAWNMIADLSSRAAALLPAGWQTALAAIGAAISDVVGVVRFALNLIYQLFFGTSGDIRAAWGDLFTGLGKLVDDFLALFTGVGPKLVDTIKAMGPLILDAFKSAFTGAINWVEGRLHAVWSAITGKHVDAETPTAAPDALPGAPTGEAGTGGKEARGWFGRMAEHLGIGGETPSPAAGGADASASGSSGSVAHSLLGNLISRGEGDYDSVNRGAAGGYAAGKEDLENMTVAQVQAAQKTQQFNAAGRYQIIGPTLDAAVKSMGLKGDEKFDRGMQDKIFEQYLAGTKRPEIGNYINGKSNDVGAAILAASKEWASVTDPTTGQSHYAGSGNNKASISVAEMTKALNEARAMASAGAGVQVAKNTNIPSAATTNTNSNEVNIASITVNTQATDANGVAKGLHQAMRSQFATAAQANAGLA